MGLVLRGTATEKVEFGEFVLCRNGQVSPAPKSIANGVARALPKWANQSQYNVGDFVISDAIDGLGERSLHELAKLPIMAPIRLNLPAGKLTEDEYQARLDLQFKEAGIRR